MNIVRTITNKVRKPRSLRAKILSVAAIVLLLAGGLALYRTSTNGGEATAAAPALPMVSLLPVSELATETTGLTLTGTLRSKSEADLRTEVPGRITGVYATVGKWLTAGTLIAEVENSAQKAQVTQALGALQAAKAQVLSAKTQLTKANNGATEQDRGVVASQVDAAQTGLNSAQDAARNALQGAYAGTVNVTSFGSDTMMRDAISVNPTLTFQTTEYSAKVATENMRLAVGEILKRHTNASAYTLTPQELSAELATAKSELITLRAFADSMLTALGGTIITAQAPATTLTTYSTTMNTARAQILANISAITAAQTGIAAARSALTTAQKNNTKVVSNVRPEDVAAAEAAVNAAQASVTGALGSYQAALAGLEKTRVRAPISGRLSRFSARRGDFVATNALGRIIGSGGNEVVFSIPSTDKKRARTGGKVLVSGTITGTITTVANSTNSFNQQLEVRADLQGTPDVPNGSVVTITLLSPKASKASSKDESLLVPINAIKFNSDTTNMFTIENVDGANILVSQPIVLGAVSGSMVFISGVSGDTLVVTDARGLTEGQEVRLLVN